MRKQELQTFAVEELPSNTVTPELNYETEIKKIRCPYCSHEQNIFYHTGAKCKGLFFKCKNKKCRKEFEIRL